MSSDRPTAPPAGRRTPSRPARSWYDRVPAPVRIVLIAVCFAAAGVGAWLLWDSRDDTPAQRTDAGSTAQPASRAEDAQVLLLVARGAGDAPPAMALVAHDAPGDVVIPLPVSTLVETPGLGPRPLDRALGEAGREGLVTSVANALRIRVPRVLIGETSDVRAFLQAVAPIDVQVPETVNVVEGGNRVEVFRQGAAQFDADMFLRFMTERFPDELELDRVSRQTAGWAGLLAALARRRAAVPLTGWAGDLEPDAAGRILQQVASDASGTTVLPLAVERVGLTGEDLYQIQEDGLARLDEALSGTRGVADVEGRRVRLLVGADGAIGPVVARKLIDAGYAIVLTGKASRPYDETQVVVPQGSDELRGRAQDIVDLLGTGRIGVFTRPTTLADIMLVVGRDWATANGYPQPRSAGG
jgi:hypothetical protein